jgi:UDP-glucose 4-epimerase
VPIAEDYTFRPETIYGASKLAGEYYAQVFNRAGWLPTVIARPFNTYGPREYFEGSKGEVIPRFITQALSGRALTVYGDGMQTRDFTYVSETAEYLVRLAEHADAGGGTFNICRGEEIAIRDVATRIAQLAGLDVSIRHLPARPSDVLRLYGSNDRLSRLLGAAPAVSLSEGLARTIDWFRLHVPMTTQRMEFLDADNWSAQEGEDWMKRAAAAE